MADPAAGALAPYGATGWRRLRMSNARRHCWLCISATSNGTLNSSGSISTAPAGAIFCCYNSSHDSGPIFVAASWQQRSETIALTAEISAMRTENARLLQELQTLKVYLRAPHACELSDGNGAAAMAAASARTAGDAVGGAHAAPPPHSAGP